MKRIRDPIFYIMVVLAALPVIPSCRKKETSSQGGAGEAKTAVQQDPKVDEVFKNILDAWNKVQSISVRVKTRIAQAAGGRGTTIGEGIYDLSKQGELIRIHFKLANILVRPMKNEPHKKRGITERLYYVTDGETMYHAKFQYQNKEVMKTNYDPSEILHIGGREVLQNLRQNNRLNVLSDTFINGRSVYFIEAIPLNGNWTSLHYFDKETGIRVEWVERDAQGKDTFKLEVFDFNPMVEFAPEHFQYTVPDDVKFMDKTGD